MWNQMFKKMFFKSDLDTSVLWSFTLLVVGIVSQGVWWEQHDLEQVVLSALSMKFVITQPVNQLFFKCWLPRIISNLL